MNNIHSSKLATHKISKHKINVAFQNIANK